MILQSFLAYIHYLSFFALISTLVLEKFFFTERVVTSKTGKLLGKVDGVYGISSILVLVTGFIRVFYTGKGSDYYFSNPFFLIKLGLFVVVGLLSIYPTVRFLKWMKLLKTTETVELEANEFHRIKNLITIELILVFLIPLFAALMARGVSI